MSSPTTTPGRGTPRRTTPKRNPLQERSPSQNNEAAGRLHKDSKPDLTDATIFTSTPFPTKPQHVLLPSTIRKQRSRQTVGNELPGFFFNKSQPDVSASASGDRARANERRIRRAPHLQLKKSVSALRDMYEAQEERSRPSSAARSRATSASSSPALRPTTSRLRSFSSSEGVDSRTAWEMLGLPKVSTDELSALPTLSEDPGLRLDSESSFASRVRNQAETSSPNVRTYDLSSPGLPAYADVQSSSDPIGAMSSLDGEVVDSSGPGMVPHDQSTILTSDPTALSFGPGDGESSPNFVQLQYSSDGMTSDPAAPTSDALEAESSPNLVKLATSSPRRSSSPTPSHASTGSNKRKRSSLDNSTYAGRTPLFFDPRQRRTLTSSPPIDNAPLSSDHSLQSSEARVLPSSPPEFESAESHSSPVIRVHDARFSTDRGSIQSAHTNLQSILSSSPRPLPQRPIIRAPKVDQFEILASQKRQTSAQSDAHVRKPDKLSHLPSATHVEMQHLAEPSAAVLATRRDSRVSIFIEDLDETLDSESIAPASAYMRYHDLNSSQVDMISDADRHEAADELGALPRQHPSFAAAMGQARSASFLGSSSSSSASRLNSIQNSMEERLQSMRSFTHRRSDSLRSFSRPGSSGSYLDHSPVPTWARRYYSGFYQNTFQYLYQSSSNLTYPVINVPIPTSSHRPASMPRSLAQSSSYETISSRTDMRHSWSQSVRSSLKSFVQPIVEPIVRPRLNVRQSHLTEGVGPLVSNPTRPKSEIILGRPQSAYQRQTIRRVSMPISAADPRYHWNGVIERPETAEESEKLEVHDRTTTPQASTTSSRRTTRRFNASINRYIPPARFMRLSTPHLHQDRRLHTGSSASHGFGAPYNAKPRWQPTTEFTDTLGRPAWFKVDIKDMQVICFMFGFFLVVPWFVGAITPLPHRPGKYEDLEKQATRVRQEMFETPQEGFDDGDIVARLRLEKHLRGLEEVKWQNARWWRRMNRWMSCVGIVVLAVVIVLSVLGTRSHWA